MSNLIKMAERLCIIAHGEQVRKYTNEPYWTHPFSVAKRIKNLINDENVIAAALLHDTVEDTKLTLEDIEMFFNPTVAQLVSEVTDVSKPQDGNRAKRKEFDRQHIAKASYMAKNIKLCDLIDNTESIVDRDPEFSKIYLKEKAALLEVLESGHPELYQAALGQLK